MINRLSEYAKVVPYKYTISANLEKMLLDKPSGNVFYVLRGTLISLIKYRQCVLQSMYREELSTPLSSTGNVLHALRGTVNSHTKYKQRTYVLIGTVNSHTKYKQWTYVLIGTVNSLTKYRQCASCIERNCQLPYQVQAM